MVRRRDAIDQLCYSWARVRRQLLGLSTPLQAREYIGAIRSTLGQRRDLHAGARSPGRVEQHFPEVYVGDIATVNAAYWRMPPVLKETMDWHYVLQEPRSKTVRADLLGISVREYWLRVQRAKTFVEGAFSIVDTVRAESVCTLLPR
jgi:hypothetical protein